MNPKKSAESVWSKCRTPQTATPLEVWKKYAAARSKNPESKESIALRNRIATDNDRLALKVAYRESLQSPEPLEDLQQLARMGLIRAIEKFDYTQGAAFSSFALLYVKGEIQHFQRDHWSHVKVPRRSFEFAAKVRAKQRDLLNQGRKVEAETIAVSFLIQGKYATKDAIEAAKAKWRQIEEEVSRQPLVPLDDVLHPAADEVDDDDRDLAARAYNGLGLLEEPIRTIVFGHVFSQLKDEQMAAKHNISIEEVRLNIQAGLKQLREGLGKQEIG